MNPPESTNGVCEPREVLAKKASIDYGVEYDPNTEIIITVGESATIFASLLGLINPGDKVLVSDLGLIL
jgi:aspartate/methionine/tyrosine aminotransferase